MLLQEQGSEAGVDTKHWFNLRTLIKPFNMRALGNVTLRKEMHSLSRYFYPLCVFGAQKDGLDTRFITAGEQKLTYILDISFLALSDVSPLQCWL